MFRRRARDRAGAPPVEVSLAATVHVGDAAYYQGLQDECESSYDCVLYELITAEENLAPGERPAARRRRGRSRSNENERNEPSASGGASPSPSSSSSTSFLPTLAVDLAPTEAARDLAAVHGLRAQLDALDLRRPGWYVADIPRAELLRMQAAAGERPVGAPDSADTGADTARDDGTGENSSPSHTTGGSQQNDDPRGRHHHSLTLGPSTPTSALPGVANKARRVGAGGEGALPGALEALAVIARGRAGGGPAKQTARMLCWLVPCPEAHLLLLDWVWGGGRPAPVLGAMLDCLASGKIESVRRLAFAQMLVSAQAKGAVGGGADVPVLVTRRNEAAVECLQKAMDADDADDDAEEPMLASSRARRYALLYGALHMPGLTSTLTDRLGFEPSSQRWRAVWRVEAPSQSRVTRWLALPSLLFLDGTDWAATVTDAARAAGMEGGGAYALAAVALYVIRHGAVYYSLGKWTLEWNKQLFDGDEFDSAGGDGPLGT